MKRTPLRRTEWRPRPQPLRAVSPRRADEVAQRRRFVAELLAESPECEIGPVLRRHGIDVGCTRWATAVHERLKRSRGGSILSWANTVAVCDRCHEWTEAEPALATEFGFLVPSWSPEAAVLRRGATD